MPINANWQAAQFLKLAGPVTITRLQCNLADLANRVIGGRYPSTLALKMESQRRGVG